MKAPPDFSFAADDVEVGLAIERAGAALRFELLVNGLRLACPISILTEGRLLKTGCYRVPVGGAGSKRLSPGCSPAMLYIGLSPESCPLPMLLLPLLLKTTEKF